MVQYKAIDDMPTMDYQNSGDSETGQGKTACKECDLTQKPREG